MPSTLMLLSNPYRPDPRVRLEARALMAAGYDVHLIAWDREVSRPKTSDEEGVHVLRLGPRSPQRDPKAILARLPRFWYRALKASESVKFDLIHAHDFDTLPLGIIISGLSGRPLVYDAHELYAKMIEGEVGPISKLIWFKERRCARMADEVITVSDALAEELSHGRRTKASVVSTSQDPSVIEGADAAEIRKKYGLKGFVVSYLGSLEPGRLVEEALSALTPELDITFVVGGSGTLRPTVEKRASENPSVKFIGTVDSDEALRITWASDLVLAMMDPGNPNNVVGTPGKIINALSVGKPVLTTKGLNIAKKVEEAGCGLAIPYSGEAFAKAVKQLKNDSAALAEMGRRGRQLYEREYSWTKSRDELLRVYKSLIGIS